MRMPRLRFTIGGLMALVLLAGIGLWARAQYLSRLAPSIPEQAALAAYAQSKLTREVAEVAVVEYMEGLFRRAMGETRAEDERAAERLRWSNPDVASDMPTIRWKQDRRPDPTPDRRDEKIVRKWEKELEALKGEVEKAKADEASKLTSYNQERARRLRLFGFW